MLLTTIATVADRCRNAFLMIEWPEILKRYAKASKVIHLELDPAWNQIKIVKMWRWQSLEILKKFLAFWQKACLTKNLIKTEWIGQIRELEEGRKKRL